MVAQTTALTVMEMSGGQMGSTVREETNGRLDENMRKGGVKDDSESFGVSKRREDIEEKKEERVQGRKSRILFWVC